MAWVHQHHDPDGVQYGATLSREERREPNVTHVVAAAFLETRGPEDPSMQTASSFPSELPGGVALCLCCVHENPPTLRCVLEVSTCRTVGLWAPRSEFRVLPQLPRKGIR